MNEIDPYSLLDSWLYLAVVIDLFARQVVGLALDSPINKELILPALKLAINRRSPSAGLVFHSDRCSQYVSQAVRDLLEYHHVRQNMSKKGDCYDNAVAESFFATLKLELVYPGFFRTRQEARVEPFEFIEIDYNRKRRHSTLKNRSPVDFETTKLVA